MEHPSLRARAGAFLTRHRRAVILWGLAAALLPIFIVGLYNRQSADDYSYAILTRHAFVENGFDLPALLPSAQWTSTTKLLPIPGTPQKAAIPARSAGITAFCGQFLSPPRLIL